MVKWLFTLSEAEATIIPEAVTHGNAYEGLSLMGKGLVTTLMGLLGTFFVLALFFITIKLMQHIKARGSGDESLGE